MKTFVYLAGRYSRNPEMRAVRDRLEATGRFKITARWIDLHIETGSKLKKSFTPDFLARETEFCGSYGQADFEDLAAADIVISFTSVEGGGKGGRHVEFGMGLALEKRSIVVGPRENVFHCCPGVEVVPDTNSLFRLLDA